MADLSLLKEKKEIIKPLAIIAAILILDLVFILRGQIIFLTKVIPESRKLKKAVITARKDISSKDDLVKRHKQLKGEILKYEKKIIREEEIPNFLSEISQIAKESNVELMQMRPLILNKEMLKDAQGRTYSPLTINLDLKCGYHRLGAFIAKLEASGRYIKVSNFDVISVSEPPFEYPIKMMIETCVVNKDEKD